VTSSFFLDYLLRYVVDSLERDVVRLNALFLESRRATPSKGDISLVAERHRACSLALG
jgi:hypothetical protein